MVALTSALPLPRTSKLRSLWLRAARSFRSPLPQSDAVHQFIDRPQSAPDFHPTSSSRSAPQSEAASIPSPTSSTRSSAQSSTPSGTKSPNPIRQPPSSCDAPRSLPPVNPQLALNGAALAQYPRFGHPSRGPSSLLHSCRVCRAREDGRTAAAPRRTHGLTHRAPGRPSALRAACRGAPALGPLPLRRRMSDECPVGCR
jgi:hypothetical protein